MPAESVDRLKSLLGFDAASAELLRDLRPVLAQSADGIADAFLQTLRSAAPLPDYVDDARRAGRIRGAIRAWIDEFLDGPRDEAYRQRRRATGQHLVDLGVSHAGMAAAMGSLRRELLRAVLHCPLPPAIPRDRAVLALLACLDLEAAILADAWHESEKYFDLVEFAPYMIHQVDRAGRIVTVNRTELERLGYTAGEMRGRRLEEFVLPEDRPVLVDHLERVFARGRSACEIRLVTSRNEIIHVEIQATGRRDPATGEAVSSRAYVRDIGDRIAAERRLDAARARERAYLDLAAVILVALDASGMVTMVNRAGTEILGRSEASIVGAAWFPTFVPATHRGTAESVFRQTLDGERGDAATFQYPVIGASGEERLIEWRHAALRDPEGRVLAVLSSGTDVTERERMTRRLIEQAGLARLGEMAAVVAHEVKNPLTGIRGVIEILRDGMPADHAHRGLLDATLERISVLNSIVNDLLLYGRPHRPEPRPVRIAALVDESAALVRADREFAGVEFRTRGPDAVVPVDPQLMRPVMTNILLNAAQAMGGRGVITVDITEEPLECRIAIADTGPGIPPDILPRIFEPFVSTKSRGTGLGLPIARRLVESHGGTLTARAGAGGGAVLEIRLPHPAPAP